MFVKIVTSTAHYNIAEELKSPDLHEGTGKFVILKRFTGEKISPDTYGSYEDAAIAVERMIEQHCCQIYLGSHKKA